MMPRTMNIPGIGPTESEIEYWMDAKEYNRRVRLGIEDHPEDCKCDRCFPMDSDDRGE